MVHFSLKFAYRLGTYEYVSSRLVSVEVAAAAAADKSLQYMYVPGIRRRRQSISFNSGPRNQTQNYTFDYAT